MDTGENSQLKKWEQGQIPSADAYETVCWGCGLRLLLPQVVPVFKCGWCGAISSHDVPAKKQGRCTNCSLVLDRILVTAIIIFILLIICGGSWAVFPVLCPDVSLSFYFHLVLTGFLSFNTLFNYCIAAFVQAGPLPQMVWGNFDYITKGALEGHRFCHICNKPKPPSAHHCRACKTCVLEMDHHCPFIGNCVGASNMRPFILFLLFAVMSNVYVLMMSISAMLKVWSSLDFSDRVRVSSMNWHIMEVLASYLQALLGSSISSSVRTIAIFYLVAASLSVIIGVGLLLYQQLRQLYDGYSFIESLQFENGNFRGSRGWRNFQRTFGHGNPAFWIFPKLASDANGKKVHEK